MWCCRDAGWAPTQSRVCGRTTSSKAVLCHCPTQNVFCPSLRGCDAPRSLMSSSSPARATCHSTGAASPCTRACQRGRHPSRATIVHDVCDADDSAPTILLRTCTKNSPRRTAMHFTCGQVSVSSGLKDPSSILRSQLPQQTLCCTRACCTSHNLVRATAFAGQLASFVTHRVCCRHRECL